jgi:hypothetical protein
MHTIVTQTRNELNRIELATSRYDCLRTCLPVDISIQFLRIVYGALKRRAAASARNTRTMAMLHALDHKGERADRLDLM